MRRATISTEERTGAWATEAVKRAAGDNRLSVPDDTTVELTLRFDQPKSGWPYFAVARNLFANVHELSLTSCVACLQAIYKF